MNWQASIDHPTDEIPLYRYMSLAKLLDLICNNTLYLSRVSAFSDAFEATIPMGTVAVWNNAASAAGYHDGDALARRLAAQMTDFRHCLFVSCWCESDAECENLWERYAGAEGVAACTTAGRLRDCLVKEARVEVGRVKYVAPSQAEVNAGDIFNLAFWKRLEFRAEHECRAVIMDATAKGAGIVKPIQSSNLIQRVIAAPRMYSSTRSALQRVLEHFLPGVQVETSTLCETPPDWSSGGGQ